ncbi:universal stress protein [Azospirillum sp. YIM DDC1]|uniref:Universal stress protein n=1 Tax=Azospirillum aestuarii TaxID=2802052 RepID=A0ABS1HZW4_9PROT|nr:universal stress protein [Azospirillum aestuarii]MBK3775890.1 universal stress protein [Azospirillum brasilense]MBK4720351.1 universal stress protein [Azospirillum aestuarii]
MSYREILVQFDDCPAGAARVEAAMLLAEQHTAHLTGLVLDIQPRIPMSIDGGVPQFVTDALNQSAAEATERTVARMDALLDRQRCVAERRICKCDDTAIDRALALNARYADLLVLGQTLPGHPALVGRLEIETVMMSCGRPVLLVPQAGLRPTIGKRIVVAWDAGRAAARAVADAMPMLEKATSVTVLVVDAASTPSGHGALPGADIGTLLARHGVTVEVASLSSEGSDVADVALNWMFDHDADLLVMGAYGHSRAREWVLGGATRSILDRMTVPVLMSH